MKIIKGMLSAAAAAVLMSAACFSASAAGKPTFSVTDAVGKPGGEVTVRCEISNNPGIIAFHLLLNYDPGVLTLKNSSGGVFSGTALGSNDQVPFSFLWSEAVKGNFTDNGTLAELTFKIKDGAAGGNYPLTLSYDEEDVFDYDMNNVHFETTAGKVTVLGDEYETPIVPVGPVNDSKADSADSSAGGKDSSAAKDDTSSSAGGQSKDPDSSAPASDSKTGDTGGGDVSFDEKTESDKDPGTDSSSSDGETVSKAASAEGSSAEGTASDETASEGAASAAGRDSEAASGEAAGGASEGTDSASEGASSEAESSKSSAAPIAISVLAAAAAGGAAIIIIMKKKKQ